MTEATKWYCVPAAMLTMINIMSRGAEHSRDAQKELYRLARQLSPKTLVDRGAEPIGWARGLDQLGFGGFEVAVFANRRQAVQAAAKAIRLTGRPAGLLAWRGAHSWVMSGFQATRDPAGPTTPRSTVSTSRTSGTRSSARSGVPSEPPDTLRPCLEAQVGLAQVAPPTHRYPGWTAGS